MISIANNGYIKRDYHRNAEELRSESAMKNIQNSLRNDLFRLLAGVDVDEENAKKKRKSSANSTRRSRATKREAFKSEEVSEQLSIEIISSVAEEPAAEASVDSVNPNNSEA